MQQVIGYIRVSTNEQFTKGGSVQAQENMIKSFCEKEKLDLVEIFSEKTHVSTRVPMSERFEGSKVVELMDNPRNDYGLVLVKLDRAFRSTAEAINHVNNWGKTKSVYILDFMNGQKFDSRDPMMKMLLSMMAVFAELERDSISKRTKAVLNDKKESQQVYCARVYGYDRNSNNELIPNPLEQEAILKIFELTYQGYALRKVAKFLNENNYPTSTGGKQWYASGVNYILKNDLYKSTAFKAFAKLSV